MARTPDQIKEAMMEVVKALDEAQIPDDLRVAAFEKGFDAMMGTDAGADQGAAAATDRVGGSDDDVPTNSPSLEAIAKRLGLDRDSVDEIFYVDGDSLGLGMASSKLAPKKAVGTQQIALLLAAGRQAGGWEEWTSSDRIRDVARDYGRYDQANFASTLRRMGDVFSFRRAGRGLEIRLTRPGYEAAANLARGLVEM